MQLTIEELAAIWRHTIPPEHPIAILMEDVLTGARAFSVSPSATGSAGDGKFINGRISYMRPLSISRRYQFSPVLPQPADERPSIADMIIAHYAAQRLQGKPADRTIQLAEDMARGYVCAPNTKILHWPNQLAEDVARGYACAPNTEIQYWPNQSAGAASLLFTERFPENFPRSLS